MRTHEKCRRGHFLTPENLYVNVGRTQTFRVCLTCQRERKAKRRRDEGLRERELRQRRSRRARNRAAVLEGVACPCGSREHLQFHHRDPAGKVWNVAELWELTEAKRADELTKCDVLCRRCHVAWHTMTRRSWRRGLGPWDVAA